MASGLTVLGPLLCQRTELPGSAGWLCLQVLLLALQGWVPPGPFLSKQKGWFLRLSSREMI